VTIDTPTASSSWYRRGFHPSQMLLPPDFERWGNDDGIQAQQFDYKSEGPNSRTNMVCRLEMAAAPCILNFAGTGITSWMEYYRAVGNFSDTLFGEKRIPYRFHRDSRNTINQNSTLKIDHYFRRMGLFMKWKEDELMAKLFRKGILLLRSDVGQVLDGDTYSLASNASVGAEEDPMLLNRIVDAQEFHC